MFQAIASGKIKAVWIMGTNPVVSLPDADKVRAALLDCELVWCPTVCSTPTPPPVPTFCCGCGWGEKDGTVTNSERRISRQRSLLSAAARPGRTGGSSLRSRSTWASPRGFPTPGLHRFFASMHACPVLKTAASVPSTSVDYPNWAMRNTMHCSRCNGRQCAVTERNGASVR